MKCIIIKTTYPNLASAKKLSRLLLEKKLAACVQFSDIQSHYLWKGEIICDKEILVSIKTDSDFYDEIEAIIKNNHEYDMPQILGIAVDKGSEIYLNWIASNLQNSK